MSKPRELYHRAINGEHTFYFKKPNDGKNVITYVEKKAYDDCKAELKMRTEMQLELQAKADKHIELNKQLLESHSELKTKAGKLVEALEKVNGYLIVNGFNSPSINKVIKVALADYRGENK